MFFLLERETSAVHGTSLSLSNMVGGRGNKMEATVVWNMWYNTYYLLLVVYMSLVAGKGILTLRHCVLLLLMPYHNHHP